MKNVMKLLSVAAGLVLPASAVLAVFDIRFAVATAVATFALVVATYVLYVEAMRLKRLNDEGELELLHYPWAVFVLGVGMPMDAVLNVVVGAYWREAPRWGDGEWLLTARLDRWARTPYPADRRLFARRICRILNKHDERHCYDGSWEIK